MASLHQEKPEEKTRFLPAQQPSIMEDIENERDRPRYWENSKELFNLYKEKGREMPWMLEIK